MSPKCTFLIPLIALLVFGCEPRERQRQEKQAAVNEPVDTAVPVVSDASKAEARAAYLAACQIAEEKAEATNAENLKRWNQDVERLTARHATAKENYEKAKKHHAEAMVDYNATVAEREATQRLNLARLLLSDGNQSIAEKRLYGIINDFPRTQSAQDAKALLAGKQVSKRKPPEATMPVAPTPPVLSLPATPKIVHPDYPLDPDEQDAVVNAVSSTSSKSSNAVATNSPGFMVKASGDYNVPHTLSSGKTVYVRAYTRRDGTHVQAHTRNAPGSGSSRRR